MASEFFEHEAEPIKPTSCDATFLETASDSVSITLDKEGGGARDIGLIVPSKILTGNEGDRAEEQEEVDEGELQAGNHQA